MAKTLNLTTGGHQESLDDLIHLQEAQQEGQTATFATMGLDFDKAYILKGCEISEDDAGFANVTAGFIFYSGEVFEVLAQQKIPEAQNYGWVLDETDRAGNPVMYANNIPHSPHNIRRLKLVDASASAPLVLHQTLWHTKVALGSEEGIVAGFDLKNPLGDSLIFNGERTGTKNSETEIVCQGRKWRITGDITITFPPPFGGYYEGDVYSIYCKPNTRQDALEFLVVQGQTPAKAILLGKVTLYDIEEQLGANVEQIYAGDDEYELSIQIELYKTGGRLVKYFPAHDFNDKTDSEGWVRVGLPIKQEIDAKLKQSLYAEVEFREHRYPYRVSLFGYLAFWTLSSPQRILTSLFGDFVPQSTKRIKAAVYRSTNRLNTFQLLSGNVLGDLSPTELNLLNAPDIDNEEGSNTMHFLGIFDTYFV